MAKTSTLKPQLSSLPKLQSKSRINEAKWVKKHQDIKDKAQSGEFKIVFLGDSISQGWNNNEAWQKYYAPRHALNAGIWSDRIEHVLWRLRDGALGKLKPDVVILLIGTNNLGSETPEQIAGGIHQITQEIYRQTPKTKILLLGLLPRDEQPGTERRKKIRNVNKMLATLADNKRLYFLNINRYLLQKDGRLSPSIMHDYIHPTRKGYSIWAKAMEPKLAQILAK